MYAHISQALPHNIYNALPVRYGYWVWLYPFFCHKLHISHPISIKCQWLSETHLTLHTPWSKQLHILFHYCLHNKKCKGDQQTYGRIYSATCCRHSSQLGEFWEAFFLSINYFKFILLVSKLSVGCTLGQYPILGGVTTKNSFVVQIIVSGSLKYS